MRTFSKLFNDYVDSPDGSILRSNTDDKFDIEYVMDPQIGKWFYHKGLKAFVNPLEFGTSTGLYSCDAYSPDSRKFRKDIRIPFSEDWEPSEKPAMDVAECIWSSIQS